MIAFYDESGHSLSTGFVSIAGFIADADSWGNFDRAWSDALIQSGAPYLHMREFAHSIGPFTGWTEAQRRALLHSCVSAINETGLIAVGAVLSVQDFNELPPTVQEMFVDPFFCCLQEVIRGASIFSGGSYGPALVVYSRQDEMAGKVRQLWDAIRGNESGKLGDLEFREMRGSPGLQASDLLAYELRHYYTRRTGQPQTPARWPFRTIVEHQRLQLRRSLLKYIPRWYLELQATGQFDRFMAGLISRPRRLGWLTQELTPLPEITSGDLWPPGVV